LLLRLREPEQRFARPSHSASDAANRSIR